MKQFNLEQFINEFGTDKQVQSLINGNGNVNRRTFDSVIKTANTRFGTITIEGRGSKRIMTCSDEKETPTIREDGRVSNGAWSKPYTKNLDIVVVSVLEQGLETDTAQTLASWAKDFGIITSKMHELLMSRYQKGLRKLHIEKLRSDSIIKYNEDRIVDDFIQMTKELTNQVAGTLERMKKAGIIEYYPVFKGHIARTDETINLHEDTYKEVVNIKRKLMDKYDVSEWYLMTFKNSPKTINFYKEYDELLALVKDKNGEELGLDYCYTAYAIILKARKKKIIAYLKKYNKEAIEQFEQDEQKFLFKNKYQFHNKRIDYVSDKAQEKVGKFLSPRQFKGLSEELGGKPHVRRPTMSDYEYDIEYYALYFEDLYVQRIGELQKYYSYSFEE
ncbi:hypothetical protein [Lysinibacillus sp. OTC-L20]|uniref:hypothetical protein n=1 Tax=Lysinibacillus sp. OTC-L20 TaxID=3342791 RepID=UPI0035B6EE4E